MAINPSDMVNDYFAGGATPEAPVEPMEPPRGPVGTDREMYADRVVGLPEESKTELIKDYFETLTTEEIEAALAEYEVAEEEVEMIEPEEAVKPPAGGIV